MLSSKSYKPVTNAPSLRNNEDIWPTKVCQALKNVLDFILFFLIEVTVWSLSFNYSCLHILQKATNLLHLSRLLAWVKNLDHQRNPPVTLPKQIGHLLAARKKKYQQIIQQINLHATRPLVMYQVLVLPEKGHL